MTGMAVLTALAALATPEVEAVRLTTIDHRPALRILGSDDLPPAEVVREAAVVNGTLGAFANGTLSFVDADGDGYLSVGDHFDVQGSPAATYEIEVSLLFGMAVRTVAVGG